MADNHKDSINSPLQLEHGRETEFSTIEENTNGSVNESLELQNFKVEEKEISAVEKKSAGHSVKFVITQANDEHSVDPR